MGGPAKISSYVINISIIMEYSSFSSWNPLWWDVGFKYTWRVSSQHGLYPFWSIWDIYLRLKLLISIKWNNKKMCGTFDHNLKYIPLYVMSYIGIIRKALFCIRRWWPHFELKKWRLTRFAMKLSSYLRNKPMKFLMSCSKCHWYLQEHNYFPSSRNCVLFLL